MKTGRRRWDIHNGYILYICGASDQVIAGLLGITEGAAMNRRKRFWQNGRS